MTKLDAGLMTSLPASDPGSAAVWGNKRINSRPQSCLCMTWSGYPSNDDDDHHQIKFQVKQLFLNTSWQHGQQHLAFEGLVAEMGLLVRGESRLDREALLTSLASERSLVGVGADVTYQVARFFELLETTRLQR